MGQLKNNSPVNLTGLLFCIGMVMICYGVSASFLLNV